MPAPTERVKYGGAPSRILRERARKGATLSRKTIILGIEACPRAALVVAILRRIAYTMLALFRSVTQRSHERRATPWQTLMTDLFVALTATTELELRDPKPLHLR